MRKCIRCGGEMTENCGIKVQGKTYGIVLTDESKSFLEGRRIEEPKVAICPECGEVSFYLEDVNKIKKISE